MAPKASGRMIRRSISESEGFASLSPEAAVLFAMMIPHFNAHGKMPGGPGVVKDEIVPLIPYLTYDNLPQYLQEISDKTNVKWFRCGTKWYLHALHFLSEHQDLRREKMGADELPSWPEMEEAGEEAPEIGDVAEIYEVVSELPENSGSSPGVVRERPSRAEGLKVRREEEDQNPTTFVGGGSGRDSRAGDPPPDADQAEEMEREVKRIERLHLQTCGLSTLPPLAMVREILQQGIPPARIDDVYQAHGGDIVKYRQRNIVERLTALRDGQERDPPPRGRRPRDGLSASERRQEATFAAAREFAGGDG
jgi:hypothetical protein